MKWLIILSVIFLSNCTNGDYGTGPSKITDTTETVVKDTAKASDLFAGKTTSWIEWEYNLPDDTTWWTFTADGTMYTAWKRKISNSSGYLPIEYYKGTWGVSRSHLMTLTPRKVIPRNGNDLTRCTWIETQLSFCYIKWEQGCTEVIYGYQAYEDGSVMSVRDGDPNVLYQKWNGRHLNDISNPIFEQL
jgi:hypothetical protein